MKKFSFVLFFLTLISAFSMACAHNLNQKQFDGKEQKLVMQEIKKELESKNAFKRMEPFGLRKFNPYLDGKWIGNAISYGCYRKGQAPGVKGPSEAEILEDLNIIIQYWNLIRVYGSDDDSERVLKVIRDNKLPVRVMLGIWVENETKNPDRRKENIEQVLKAIELANEYSDIIAAVNVGNESQVFWSWHRMDMQKLIRYIRAVRNNTTVPVTCADDYNFWNNPDSKKVADEIDFIVTHIYPLWNGKTLDIAIEWMDSTYKDVQMRHPEKTIVLGEIGWATTYNPEKNAPGEQGALIKGKVGLDDQEKYLLMHNDWVNKNKVTTFLFEAFDEPWKGGGDNSGPDEVEKHWGVFYENRMPKESFQNFLKSQQK